MLHLLSTDYIEDWTGQLIEYCVGFVEIRLI